MRRPGVGSSGMWEVTMTTSTPVRATNTAALYRATAVGGPEDLGVFMERLKEDETFMNRFDSAHPLT
jgi:hypothetical protein